MFKVFLVEDEVVVREGIRKNILWEQYGFHYAGDAPDGELALPLIRQIRPDLLITDIKMPFMDGLSLIELVRSEQPGIRILIISGYDDFTYAQKAIGLGVEQYLLKPILKDKLAEVLTMLQQKMKSDLQRQAHAARFAREAREYELDSRRRFFEKLVTGSLGVSEMTDTARSMGIDVNASCYGIVLYSLGNIACDGSTPERCAEVLVRVQERITQYVSGHPELILFRWDMTTFAILVKGSQEEMETRTRDCIGHLRLLCESAECGVDWHVAAGTPVSRLESLPVCFSEANRVLSYRYLCPDDHVLSEASIQPFHTRDSRSTEVGNNGIDRAYRDGENRKQQSNLLRQAIQYIDANYQDEMISLDRVARQVNISPNYFSAVFSQEIGQTFIEYLTGKRITEAKRLLRQSDLRSGEIAAAVGYKDSHYFSFVFRKVAGCTPSEYRRGNQVCV